MGEGSEDTGEYVGDEGRWWVETTLTILCIEFVFFFESVLRDGKRLKVRGTGEEK